MIERFNRWLSAPFRAMRSLFPFSHEGRQTLIYLMFSLSTGLLTLAVWWAMDRLFAAHEWLLGKQLADKIAWALLISVAAYACFVSLRAISLGKDGFTVSGRDQGGTQASVTTTTTATVAAPQGGDDDPQPA